MNYDLDKFGLSEEELFSPVDNSSLESEKITAPRYSYWHSVFRVFFKKKINIAVLCLLGVILLMTYVYPLFVEYDRFANLMNGATKHLSPGKALQQLGDRCFVAPFIRLARQNICLQAKPCSSLDSIFTGF